MRAELRLTILPAAACCWLAQGAVAHEPSNLHSFPSIVLYELPPGTLGGTPVMLIDKITCTVVSSIHEQ